MAVLTENDVRRKVSLEGEGLKKELYVSQKDILTPSAKSFLTEKNIQLKYVEDSSATKVGIDESKNQQTSTVETYRTLFGAVLKEKPEHMTHLRGNVLVFKNHPRIAFRGKIDSLESSVLQVQILASKQNLNQLVEDLQEILTFIRNLIRCEVSGEVVGEFKLQGLDAPMLREQSHHPSKYFGIRHFLPHYEMGELVIELNKLRTEAREVELVAYDAFVDQYGNCERTDILTALNRLSSLFWIMLFKVRTNKYS